ncbi:hypothetical protein DYB32_004350 [Aphanomyces invadans]|uniref:Uncharacterized protein n=1 Tax=Aphanomyces invadans TaxID=157072 RepID=A0A418AXX6_9STRA|nr:hypothetical protein DYB32_004350 [Aphanomyces invadans]
MSIHSLACISLKYGTGLGIDDGNALINELDSIYKQLKKRKPMQLDTLESQLDILDRDTLGPLDKRISEVKRRLEGLQSAYYTSCSLIVHGDIHVELIIRQDSTVLLQKKRRCDDITTCSCPVDAAPWVNFMINPSTIPAKPTVQPKAVTVVPDVNLNDLKKSYGVDVEERERNLESFQNEVDYGVVIADETSSHCDAQLFPPSKRARRPPPKVSPIYDPPDNMNLSCPKTNAGIKQEHGDLVQVILATSITPTPSAGGAHCSVQYGDIVSWGSIPRKSRIEKVLDAVATTSMCIHTWTMHDMDVSVDEMMTFADAITADSSALQPLAALNARSINFDPSKWAMPLNHVLAGLAACATAGQLKRLSLADNAFKRAFLVKLFQTLQVLQGSTETIMLTVDGGVRRYYTSCLAFQYPKDAAAPDDMSTAEASLHLKIAKANPYAVEAALALAEITGKNEERKPNPLDESEIVHLYTELGTLMRAVDALESLEDVERVLGTTQSLHCHLHRAKVLMDLERPEQAMAAFVQARKCDANSVLLMDVFALVLKQSGLTMQLNSLVRDLFRISETKPEVWLAAACYSDLKADRPAALQLCDRVRSPPTFHLSIYARHGVHVSLQAIAVDPTYARSYVFRGYVLLALDRPEYAINSFSHATKLDKTIDAYEGMGEGLCGICLKGVDKYMEAMNVARLALMYMPHSPRAYLLLGSVLSLKPDSRDKARKAFEKALSMRPKLLRAHFGLVDILIAEAKYADAIQRLEMLTHHFARDVVFAKLGDVHTLNRSYGLALPQYHHALSINPTCVKALRGIDRVEKLLRGEDDSPGRDRLEFPGDRDDIRMVEGTRAP